jgi:hypothetical protein
VALTSSTRLFRDPSDRGALASSTMGQCRCRLDIPAPSTDRVAGHPPDLVHRMHGLADRCCGPASARTPKAAYELGVLTAYGCSNIVRVERMQRSVTGPDNRSEKIALETPR